MEDKTTTFYEELQRSSKLDLRDPRGKRHNLALILVEFTLALLCNRDGNLSSIHRHMKNHHKQLLKYMGLEAESKKQYLGRICPYC